MERLTDIMGMEKPLRYHKTINSPVGNLDLVADDENLLVLTWSERHSEKVTKVNAIIEETERQLREYFEKKRRIFELPLFPSGTDFQKKAWRELLNIPYGEYITYGEQARRIGKPTASRAVGGANGKNPIAIIIPCHRVIGASGDLTGFGGGLGIKKHLLALEASCQ